MMEISIEMQEAMSGTPRGPLTHQTDEVSLAELRCFEKVHGKNCDMYMRPGQLMTGTQKTKQLSMLGKIAVKKVGWTSVVVFGSPHPNSGHLGLSVSSLLLANIHLQRQERMAQVTESLPLMLERPD